MKKKRPDFVNTLFHWGLLLVLPLFFLPFQQNPFLPSKLFALNIIVFSSLFLWHQEFKKKIKKEKRKKATSLQSSILLLSFLLLFLLAISTIFSIDIKKSFFGSFGRYQGLLTWLTYFICLFLAYEFAIEHKRGQLWRPLSFSTSLCSIYAIFQSLGLDFITKAKMVAPFGLERASGTFETASFLGTFLTLSLPILIFSYLKEKRVILASSVALGLIALLLTFSRGAWLGLFAGLAFTFVITSPKRTRFLISSSLLLLLSLLLYFASFYMGRTGTVIGRLAVWKVSLSMISSQPLLGSGGDTFLIKFPLHISEDFERTLNITTKMPSRGAFFDRAHNFFIDLSSEFGIFFLLLLLTLIFLFWIKAFLNLKESRKGKNYEVMGILAATISYSFSLLFHFFSPDTAPIFFLLVGRGLAFIQNPENKRKDSPDFSKKYQRKIEIVTLFLLLLSFISLTASALLTISNYYLFLGLESYKKGEAKKVQEFLHKAQSISPWETEFNLIEGRSLFLLGKNFKDPELLELSVQAFMKATQKSPLDERGYFSLGNARLLQFELTNERSLLLEAKNAYQKVLSVDPNYGNLRLQMGVVKFYEGNIKGAIREWEKAHYLAPERAAPLKNLITAYKKLGDSEKVKELQQKLKKLKK
jgi:putative inorganic carbon (HCO3(-)) transporter